MPQARTIDGIGRGATRELAMSTPIVSGWDVGQVQPGWPLGSIRAEAYPWVPRVCVWELTLACNLRCHHCGSVAGRPRRGELSLERCLKLVDELAALGCELVTLSGGEPTLKRGWDVIARAIFDRGMLVNMVTNGVTRNERHAIDLAERALAAGMCNVGVSLDGPPHIHDRIRGPGTFLRTLATIRTFVSLGLPVGVLTTVNRWNLPHLEATRRIARDAGATQFRVQLAKPMGRLADHAGALPDDDFVLSPEDLLTLIPELARMARLDEIRVHVGDSIGYYGPHDEALRGRRWDGQPQCWRGCQAGLSAIGIEADGTVKGCLSLQARPGDVDPFAEGNVKEHTLAEIWRAPGAFAYNRQHTRAQLTGPCARCAHAERCRGGARCVSSAAIGSVTEDPYCWFLVSGEIDRQQGDTPSDTRRSLRSARCVASIGALAAMAGCGSDPQSGDVADVTSDTAEVVDTSDTTPETDGTPPTDTLDDTGPTDVADVADVADTDVPDVADTDATDTDVSDVVDTVDGEVLDCSVVCCACEYGMIPDEVWQACCKICEDACCDCDYGVPPPPQCCP